MTARKHETPDVRIVWDWFPIASFGATIAFALGALLGLLWAGVMFGLGDVILLALAALAMSYVSQSLASWAAAGHDKLLPVAIGFQMGAMLLFLAGLVRVFLTLV